MNAPINIKQQIENRMGRLRAWRPEIERALRDADLMTYADIEQGVLDVRYLYFDNDAAFAIIEVHDFSKGRVCHILAAGGSTEGLRELQETLMPFFKQIGAKRLTMVGRRGFIRKLPALGWTSPRVYMECPL